MAAKKITALPELTAPVGTDVVAYVKDPATNPASRKTPLAAFKTFSNYRLLIDTGAGVANKLDLAPVTFPAGMDTGEGFLLDLRPYTAYPTLDIYGWIHAQTDSLAFWLEGSCDSGKTWLHAENQFTRMRFGEDSSGAGDAQANASDDLINLHSDVGNAANERCCFHITVFNWSRQIPTHFHYELALNHSDGEVAVTVGAAVMDTGSDLNFIALNGNATELADSGKIQVYGMGAVE